MKSIEIVLVCACLAVAFLGVLSCNWICFSSISLLSYKHIKHGLTWLLLNDCTLLSDLRVALVGEEIVIHDALLFAAGSDF